MGQKKYKYYLRFRRTSKNPLKNPFTVGNCDIILSGDSNPVISGPHPLPKKRKRFSINRSHNLHKKSQEQLEIIEYSSFWIYKTNSRISSETWINLFGQERIEGVFFDWKEFEVPLVYR